jgi:hypothetical protein
VQSDGGGGWQQKPWEDPEATEEDALLAWEGDVPDYGGSLSMQVRGDKIDGQIWFIALSKI